MLSTFKPLFPKGKSMGRLIKMPSRRKETALEQAVGLACETLLRGAVPRMHVSAAASELQGRKQGSAHELAVSAAAVFFRAPGWRAELATHQFAAVMLVREWQRAGQVTHSIADAFEELLLERTGISDAKLRGGAERVERWIAEFRAKSRAATLEATRGR